MTAEQFDQLPAEEGLKYELLDGELIEVSSATMKHNIVLATLIVILERAMSSQGLLVPDTEFVFPGETRIRPDLSVLLDPARASSDLERVPVRVTPDIVAEIVSPSETNDYVTRKVQCYLSSGVSEVLTIHPSLRLVYVYTRESVRLLHEQDRLTLHSLPHLDIPVSAVFARI